MHNHEYMHHFTELSSSYSVFLKPLKGHGSKGRPGERCRLQIKPSERESHRKPLMGKGGHQKLVMGSRVVRGWCHEGRQAGSQASQCEERWMEQEICGWTVDIVQRTVDRVPTNKQLLCLVLTSWTRFVAGKGFWMDLHTPWNWCVR